MSLSFWSIAPTFPLPAPLPAGVEDSVAADAVRTRLQELQGESLHRDQGDAVLWAEWCMEVGTTSSGVTPS